MPIAVTYPGVYIEELDSGPAAIAGVATNICAFVGRALFGPTDKVMTCFNYGDYIRNYGGLQFDYPMSYAVQDFFNNGGSQAVIARLFEPDVGSGVAQLKFPPAPIDLPEEWLLDGDAAKGATTLIVAPPTNPSPGAPDAGMVLTVPGDGTQYMVTKYAVAAGKNPATVAIVPALTEAMSRCTPLTFGYGPSPTGWTVQSQSQGKVTLTGGSGLPELGQTFVFGSDPNSYTAISQPTVSLDGLQVTLTVTPPPPPSVTFGTTATVSDPVPLPMPIGWQIDKFIIPKTPSSTGSMTLIHGIGAPQPGDIFTIGNAADKYIVKSFTPVSTKVTEAILTFSAESGKYLDPKVFCHCCPPIFSRPPPQKMGIKAGPKKGDIKFTYQRGTGASGVVDIGDTFTIGNDPSSVYSVRYVDSNLNIYFLPEAATAFGATDSIAFSPPLTLAAADPGKWGNFLTATADTNGITPRTAKQFKAQYGLEPDDLFNLTLTLTNAQGKRVASESYLNVSVRMDGDAAHYPNRLDRVLQHNSELAVVSRMPGTAPGNTTAQGVGGNDGTYLTPATCVGDQSQKTGIYLLETTPLFNLLCFPPDRRILSGIDLDLDPLVRGKAAEYCTDRRAFYVVDPLAEWAAMAKNGDTADIQPDDLDITGMNKDGIEIARNSAVYFPRLVKEDILMKSQPATFAPCGAVAGIMAATDVARGVWKAPAGTGAGVGGILGFDVHVTDDENGQLNPLGINCLRNLPTIGPVVWGARTLRGADAFEDAYKYIPVRRLTLFIEDSLYRGTQWAVFEPNDEALWSALRLQVGGFLADLARQGAFYNYAVTCDATTTTEDDIANGVVNILVQIAPVKPAEFVVLQIQQIAGGKPA